MEVELPTTTRCCGCGLVPDANPVRPGMVRAKFARRVSPCFVGTADQVRPRVTKATSAHRVPTWFVHTPTQCLPGWRASSLSECATGQHGLCMLVRHEVPPHTSSSGGHRSATRAHGTHILDPHGLAACCTLITARKMPTMQDMQRDVQLTRMTCSTHDTSRRVTRDCLGKRAATRRKMSMP